MTMEAKIRPWLLWTLLGVVLIGGGFTYWYISGGKGGTTTTTSPTATKSAVVSPGTTPTATKTGSTTGGTGSTTNTNGGQTATPTTENKTWEGRIHTWGGGSCTPDVSFEYPSDYQISYGSQYITGYTSVHVSKNDQSDITLDASTQCTNFSTAQQLFEDFQKNLDSNTKIISGPNYLNINSASAVQWSDEQYNPNTNTSFQENRTAIINPNGNTSPVYIYYRESSNEAAYNTVVGSLRFK